MHSVHITCGKETCLSVVLTNNSSGSSESRTLGKYQEFQNGASSIRSSEQGLLMSEHFYIVSV